MICKNCGAEFDDNEIKCPYCGTENEVVAKERNEKRLLEVEQKYETEIKQLEEIPKKAGKITRKGGLFLLGIIAVVVIAGAIVAIIWGTLSSNLKYRMNQKHLERLEKLYVNEEYGQIEEYISKHNLYDSSYDKYSQISNAFTYQEMFEQNLERVKINKNQKLENATDREYNWDIYFTLSYSNWVLADCMEYAEDDQWCGNEEKLLLMADEVTEQLKEQFSLNDDELELLESKDTQDEEIEKLAIIITERVRKML